MQETAVLIVEPDLEIQRVYRQKLIHDPNIQLLGICSSAASATAILSRMPCDVLFTELTLPDGDGVDLITQAIAEFHIERCVVITARNSLSDVDMAMESGAIGYILKGEPGSTEIASFVRLVVSGGSPISPAVASMVIQSVKNRRNGDIFSSKKSSRGSSLSKRESEIIQLMAQGKSSSEMAELLNISHHTVTAHVKKIYRKLQVHSRTEAIEEAAKRKLLGEANIP